MTEEGEDKTMKEKRKRTKRKVKESE